MTRRSSYRLQSYCVAISKRHCTIPVIEPCLLCLMFSLKLKSRYVYVSQSQTSKYDQYSAFSFIFHSGYMQLHSLHLTQKCNVLLAYFIYHCLKQQSVCSQSIVHAKANEMCLDQVRFVAITSPFSNCVSSPWYAILKCDTLWDMKMVFFRTTILTKNQFHICCCMCRQNKCAIPSIIVSLDFVWTDVLIVLLVMAQYLPIPYKVRCQVHRPRGRKGVAGIDPHLNLPV